MNMNESDATTGSEHAHRGRIAEPQGPVGLGICGRCGLHREFRNYLESGDFVTNEEHRIMNMVN